MRRRESSSPRNKTISSRHENESISTSRNNKNIAWMRSMEKNWLDHLKKLNLNIQNERSQSFPFLATPTTVVHLIFKICRCTNQSPDVRYLAVEIFDRFSYYHFKSLIKNVWVNNEYEECTKKWKHVMSRVKSQFLLRLLSCIQISAKFTNSQNQKLIQAMAVKKFLSKAGKVYSLRSILASEVRVLKTIDFKSLLTS
uniref:Cyclin N-terminal domain-containing protein n=1 Tax=Clastoptera arizonana TaxID=38151 RepID=A0A1B6DNG8_9HEMI